jgi:hypothetical protein
MNRSQASQLGANSSVLARPTPQPGQLQGTGQDLGDVGNHLQQDHSVSTPISEAMTKALISQTDT